MLEASSACLGRSERERERMRGREKKKKIPSVSERICVAESRKVGSRSLRVGIGESRRVGKSESRKGQSKSVRVAIRVGIGVRVGQAQPLPDIVSTKVGLLLIGRNHVLGLVFVPIIVLAKEDA